MEHRCSEDEDLSVVLTRIKRPRAATSRDRKVNSPATRLFLDAGVVILNESLPFYQSQIEGDYARIFEPLTRAAVCTGAGRLAGDGVQGLGPGAWANRWEYKEDYVTDLVSYVLRPGPWANACRAQRESLGALSHRNLDLATLLARFLEEQLRSQLSDPSIVLAYALTTALPNHPLVREANERLYDVVVDELRGLLLEIGSIYGVQPASGRSWRDTAVLLDTVAEGCFLRITTAERLGTLDDKASVIGYACALVAASLQAASSK